MILPLLMMLLVTQEPILFASIPKSGTHLIRKAIELITKKPVHWVGLSDTAKFDPGRNLKKGTPITALHLFPEVDRVRADYSDKYIKVLMIRDPRDVMLSFRHHLLQKMTWSACPTFDYDKFAALSFDDQLRETLLFPAEYRNPSTCFKVAIEWMHDPTVLVCRFEDLVGPEGGGSSERQLKTLRDLADHLGYLLNEEEILSLAKKLFGGTWTFRKGQINSWKELYSEENEALFMSLMGQDLLDLGYNW